MTLHNKYSSSCFVSPVPVAEWSNGLDTGVNLFLLGELLYYGVGSNPTTDIFCFGFCFFLIFNDIIVYFYFCCLLIRQPVFYFLLAASPRRHCNAESHTTPNGSCGRFAPALFTLAHVLHRFSRKLVDAILKSVFRGSYLSYKAHR